MQFKRGATLVDELVVLMSKNGLRLQIYLPLANDQKVTALTLRFGIGNTMFGKSHIIFNLIFHSS